MSDVENVSVNGDEDIVRMTEVEQNDENQDDEMQGVNFDGEADGEVKEDENDEKKGAAPAKKKTTRKLFVLNVERLKGKNGVLTIEKLYEGFQFKGHGHEKEDLNRVMKRLEYWAYRCYPKLHFDDFLAKCEHLGHKKELQTYLKRYRLGMISADDFDRPDEINEEEEDANDADKETENNALAELDNDAVFQRLFDEEMGQIS